MGARRSSPGRRAPSACGSGGRLPAAKQRPQQRGATTPGEAQHRQADGASEQAKNGIVACFLPGALTPVTTCPPTAARRTRLEGRGSARWMPIPTWTSEPGLRRRLAHPPGYPPGDRLHASPLLPKGAAMLGEVGALGGYPPAEVTRLDRTGRRRPGTGDRHGRLEAPREP
jgi:hypothetical protein